MEHKRYQEIVNETTPKPNKMLNMFIAFFTGGVVATLGTLLYNWLLNFYNSELSIAFMLLIMIVGSALITALGIGDTLFQTFKCGLIIPITGFAHSITSSIIDYKREGLLNMGSNAFKLAGSVILYGIVSAVILTLIKVLLNV